ncbi:MAG: alpha/beta hydrolase [Cyanobacteria bacterium P01_E01_bin.34]
MKSNKAHQPKYLPLSSGYRALYRDWGKGLPVVFLHGLMGNHRHWLGVMQGLKRDYRCIAVDLLGFGESSEPVGTCGIGEQVAFVREIVQALALDRCVLVGHSLGGWIAAEYSLLYQNEIAGLVLAAPAGIQDRAFNRHYLMRWPLTWDSNWIDWFLGIASKVYEYLGHSDRLSILRLERKALLAQSTARQFVTARAFNQSNARPIEQALHQIRISALVIAAEQDTLIPQWCCEQYANSMPKAQLEILFNASHRLPIDHWREMLPLIQAFLASLQDSKQTEPVDNDS